MSNKNWEQFGEEIRRTVQDAIENQNYEKLSEMISDTVNQAVDTVAEGIKTAAGTSKTKYQGYKTYTTDAERAKRKDTEPIRTSGMKYSNAKTDVRPRPMKGLTKAPSKTATLLVTGLGYSFGAVGLVITLLFLVGMFLTAGFGAGVFISGSILTALALCLLIFGFRAGILGTQKLLRLERFEIYQRAIGEKEYCNLSELSAAVRKPLKTVQKDLDYMIRKRWFLQGHLDYQKSCLMITDRMYSEYCQLEKQKAIEEQEAKQRELAAKKEQEEKIAAGKRLSPEVQKVIEQGDMYIKKIRACNDAIPGEEISEKIYRIELLVDNIFDRVEQEPKCVSDIRKLMDYYLPTTVKLLEAYAEMDAQPAGGENIQTAKREIEATLDTLNIAFEKLLDGLFQEKAWDVSSDISVLNTMLAQEGLKEDGLKKK